MFKNCSKKKLLIFAFLVLFLQIQFFNHTGFCYSERRYLNKRELVDRYLFGKNADHLTNEQKVELAKSVRYSSGIGEIDYPNCCTVKNGHLLISKMDHFLNRTFLGKYLFEIRSYFPMKEKTSGRYPYTQYISHLDACGVVITGDNTSIDESDSAYRAALERNSSYWTRYWTRLFFD